MGDYLGKEPDKLPGEGGVFNPVNLNPYHYAAYNPIVYNDPTGEDHRRYLIGAQGTRAHTIIGNYYRGKLQARGYNDIRVNMGMKYLPRDQRCYSRKRPDIRADRAGVKYIWEIKQNGVNGVNDSLDSLEMYNQQAVAAGDVPLIPGEPLEAVILQYDPTTYLRVYSVGNGIVLYEAWQRDGKTAPVPIPLKVPDLSFSVEKSKQFSPNFSYNSGFTGSYAYYSSNSSNKKTVLATIVAAAAVVGRVIFSAVNN